MMMKMGMGMAENWATLETMIQLRWGKNKAKKHARKNRSDWKLAKTK
jgi:hypothetical protein